MNTSEVIQILSQRLQKPQTEIKNILKTTFEAFRSQLAEHNHFTVPGFGTFDIAERKPRKSYNPHLKKIMILPTKIVSVFRPSKSLKDKVK